MEESYLQRASYLDLNIIHLYRDHKLPLWAFHFNGGYPFIKHPDNPSLSPLFYLLVLPFGTAIGMKLLLLSSYFIGAVGFFVFARRILKYNLIVSTITSMFFIFNSFIAFQINTGNFKDHLWFYLPIISYALFRSKENMRWIFYCGAFITLAVLGGLSLYLAPMLLFLFILAILDPQAKQGARIPNKKLLTSFFLVIVVALMLGAVRFIPTLGLLNTNDRGIDDYKAASDPSMTPRKLMLAMLSRGPYAVGNEEVMGDNGLGIDCVMYFGVIPIAMFIASCVLCFRKIWKFILVTIIFLWICMTQNAPIDLFYPLWRLPGFHSIHDVARYFSFPVVFMVPIVAGEFFSSKIFKNLNKNLKILIFIIAIIGAADMFIANTQYYAFTGDYQETVPQLNFDNDFFNVEKISANSIETQDSSKDWGGKYKHELPLGIQYYMLRQNIGLVNWYGNIELPSDVKPRYLVLEGYGEYWDNLRRNATEDNGVFYNEEYKGEAFFLYSEENKIKNIVWKANKIIIKVNMVSKGTLVINQNYDAEWKSNSGNVINSGGLIGIELNAPLEEEVVLTYHPKSFYVGLGISLVSLFLFLGILWVTRNKNECKK